MVGALPLIAARVLDAKLVSSTGSLLTMRFSTSRMGPATSYGNAPVSIW